MDAAVNLTNLRSMTDGDKDMEKELFEEFYSSFEMALNLLKLSYGDSATETWRSQTHALKGIALNLGAEKLGTLCKRAQDEFTVPENVKKEMLENIQTEYGRVKVFLQKTN